MGDHHIDGVMCLVRRTVDQFRVHTLPTLTVTAPAVRGGATNNTTHTNLAVDDHLRE